MKRKGGFVVNPGRKPTPIGGDGILPYVVVPHWFAGELRRVLRKRSIEFEVRCGFSGRPGPTPGTLDPVDHEDRFSFPRATPDYLQALINSIEFDPGW